MDPFASALVAIFNAPGSDAAVYTPVSGDPFDVRVILSSRDQVERFGSGELILESNLVELMRSQVDAPVDGDRIQIMRDDEVWKTLELHGEATTDESAITWFVGAAEV